MSQIDLNHLLLDRFEKYFANKPAILRSIILRFLNRILYIKEINKFLASHDYLDTKQFINEVFDNLNFSFLISSSDLQKIPSEGGLICVANHPIGSLDGLSLIKILLEVRSDVKIIANDILYSIDNLKPVLIPIKLDSTTSQKNNLLEIYKVLANDSALIIFPAASVSRLSWFKVTDSKWNKGAIYLARKFQVPVLPMHITGKNSLLFYSVSLISQKLSMLLLAHELFNHKKKSIHIRIGDTIPPKAFSSSIDDLTQSKLLKKHVYNLAKNGKKIYITEKNVIHPIDRKAIKSELNNASLIGCLQNRMKIFLTTKQESPQTINEISRLREITFRKVGEGTGGKMDMDIFDSSYHHLIIWDENELDIVGAYRLGIGSSLIEQRGKDAFYTSTLFEFSDEFINNYLPFSIELGRSFVQKKYWNTNALNYLWQGIGTFLTANENIKYFFGGVSISNNYPVFAKDLMVYFFQKWYPDYSQLANSRRKYFISEKRREEYAKLLHSHSLSEDYKTLKIILRALGYSIPPLLKHYTHLCEKEGVRFLDFGVDPNFENCIDGLILIDVGYIKPEKKSKFVKQPEQFEFA